MVDGEHYPPVIAGALDEVRAAGHEVPAAVLVGGTEKLPAGGLDSLAGAQLFVPEDIPRGFREALDEVMPDAVLDLSDEPVLDNQRRFRLASIALSRNVAYRGHDFSFSPPPRPRLVTKPSIAVIGTGKRTGKTAVCAHLARLLAGGDLSPVVLAMGRGGPEEPEVLRGDEVDVTAEELVGWARLGRHAASDYIEDALLARVPTVGCRRCGGGVAGAATISNVPRGIELLNGLPGRVALLEGSGAAIPPAHADATILVVPAGVRRAAIEDYLGPYRLLLADQVVITMAEEPFGSPSQVDDLISLIHSTAEASGRSREEALSVVRTVFRPTPTRSVDGARVFVATTAPTAVGEQVKRHLESEHGCEVVGMTHSLSDRRGLMTDLEGLVSADILLCEIKAAAIDVAASTALDRGVDVIFMDNVPTTVGGDDVDGSLLTAARTAVERYAASGRT